MRAAPAAPRHAATVLSLRPHVRSAPHGCDYQVLMMKRSETARFMPGAHVFPGGVVEHTDSDPRWKSSLSPKAAQFRDLNFRIGGVRELFEETGVLLTEPQLPETQRLKDHRAKLLKDSNVFYDMCTEFNILPDVERMYPLSRWVTPEHEKYRYDTIFYVAPLRVSPQVVLDEREGTRLDWFTPQEALEAFKAKRIYLPPPTYVTLQQLNAFHNVKDLLASLLNQKEPQTIAPVFIINGDVNTLVLPGDPLHPTSANSRKRHRYVFRSSNIWEYQLDDSLQSSL